MKLINGLCALLMLTSLPLLAENPVIPVWPDKVPGKVTDKEETSKTNNKVTRLSNVSVPTMTTFLLPGDTKRPLAIICPGGGYRILAWDKEGTEYAEWLNKQGMHAIVLKYRVPGNREGAFQDVQRSIRYVRSKAKEWHVKEDSIGAMGSSAGGHLAASASMRHSENSYEAIDDADTLSARPDFNILIYPAYLAGANNTLAEGLSIPADHPPCYMMAAKDDSWVTSTHAYSKALQKAGIPQIAHIFDSGGHGFGLRKNGKPSDFWPNTLKAWLVERGLAEKE